MEKEGFEAYVLPKFLIREKVYRLAESDEEQFVQKCLKLSNLAKGDYEKSGFAYAISKNFAIWYSKKALSHWAQGGFAWSH